MRKKLLLVYIGITVLLVGLSAVMLYQKTQAVYISSQTKQLMASGLLLEDILGELPLDQGLAVVYDYDRELDVRISIISASQERYGQVLVDTQYDEAVMGNHQYREEVQQALDGQRASSIRHSSTLDMDYLYAAMPAVIAGEPVVLRLAEPLAEVALLNDHLLMMGVLVLALIVAVGVLLYYGTLRRLTKPLDEINAGVLAVAGGVYEVKLPLYRDAEFNNLAQSFNTMVKQQKAYIEGLRVKNAELAAIFDSVGSGIAFLDGQQEVKVYNALFLKLLQLPQADYTGRKYFQLLHTTELLEQIAAGFAQQSYRTQELALHAQAEEVLLKVTTAPVRDQGGLLVVVEDVTQLKHLENIRREFVANVSHELKTPLTTIRGFIDTLQGGALEDAAVAQKFLGIIDEEAERLYRMIQQLLYLSQIENTKPIGRITEIDLARLAESTACRFKRQLAQKGLTLTLEVPPEARYYGDQDALQQIVINLIDNAIKYSDSGEIVLRLAVAAGSLECSVSDQGRGIAQEDQKRIFERFYRAEKSRAQKNGGTGLGLAIVKHLVENAQGTITVQSRLGEGACFTIRLPEAGANEA